MLNVEGAGSPPETTPVGGQGQPCGDYNLRHPGVTPGRHSMNLTCTPPGGGILISNTECRMIENKLVFKRVAASFLQLLNLFFGLIKAFNKTL
jgi:hypothetical protein